MYWVMIEIQSPETWQVLERMVSTLEQMQVPNGTGPDSFADFLADGGIVFPKRLLFTHE